MKHTLLLTISYLILALSCTKELNHKQDNINESARISLSINKDFSNLTKSINKDWKDKDIKSLKIFIFNQDKSLEIAEERSSSENIELFCHSGEGKSIYVLANYNKDISINNEAQISSLYSSLEDNNIGSFVMCGKLSNVRIEDNGNYNISIKRIAAKISIDKISNDIQDLYLKQQSIKLKSIYLINAVTGRYNMFATDFTPTTWTNKQRYTSNTSFDNMTYDYVNSPINNNESYIHTHTFYCYPNPISTDNNSSVWSARKTRLVIEVMIGSKTYYYPLSLPIVKANTHYHFKSLSITRKGSDNPDLIVSSEQANFNIVIEDWNDSQMGSIII